MPGYIYAHNQTSLGNAVTTRMPDGTYEVVADARVPGGVGRVKTTVLRLGRHFVDIGPGMTSHPWQTRPSIGDGAFRTLQDAVEATIAAANERAILGASRKRA